MSVCRLQGFADLWTVLCVCPRLQCFHIQGASKNGMLSEQEACTGPTPPSSRLYTYVAQSQFTCSIFQSIDRVMHHIF